MKEKYYSNVYKSKLKKFLFLKNIEKKRKFFHCIINFKIELILKKNFFVFKIIYFIVLLIFLKIYKLNLFNKDINKNYYYSYTKYKIYHRIKKKKFLKKIKFGIYITSLSNGGRERITSLLINYLSKEKIFDIFLFTKIYKNRFDYKIHKNVNRIKISNFKDLKKKLIQKNIEVFVYQSYNIYEIKILNKLKNVKTIFYNHSSFLFWIYFNKISFLKKLYNSYKKSQYVISLIPFENDYLFKKWRINSILMNNFITYKYDDIIPSNLSSKIIIMIGRANDKLKRFNLGIRAMKYIVKEIPDCKMKIISSLQGIKYLKNLIDKLNLKNNIKFEGFTLNPEIFYNNASLHIFPSLIESFGMVLSETKIFGIPNIICGIDYVLTGKDGVININDDNPKNIANESIKILKNDNYRKKLGNLARKSMKKFKNELTLRKWIDLILAVYKGQYYYNKLREENRKISEKEAINQLKNQLKLIKMRKSEMQDISLKDLENFNFVDKYLKFRKK